VALAPHPREARSKTPARPVAVAPAPHDAPPEVAVAPRPRPVVWKFAGEGYSSKWETVGVVEVRVAHVGVGKNQIVDSLTDEVTEPKAPALVVVVEARLRDPGRERSHLSWTDRAKHYKTAFIDGTGRELAPRDLPPGHRLNTGLTFPVPFPKDEEVLQDVLVFEIPPAGTRELELRLEAERVRENGNYWFKIPASAWGK
jgi:hypothetical protein